MRSATSSTVAIPEQVDVDDAPPRLVEVRLDTTEDGCLAEAAGCYEPRIVPLLGEFDELRGLPVPIDPWAGATGSVIWKWVRESGHEQQV
jgi:hypothetical protein